MRNIDLSPLYRSFIGFDRLAALADSASRTDGQSNYPPYNIELLEENKYRVSMAVAGFHRDNVDIEVKEQTLTIRGTQPDLDERAASKFLHKGISERNFERKFQLGDHVKVNAAALENGLLHIDLERVIPEEKKPRKVEIGA